MEHGHVKRGRKIGVVMGDASHCHFAKGDCSAQSGRGLPPWMPCANLQPGPLDSRATTHTVQSACRVWGYQGQAWRSAHAQTHSQPQHSLQDTHTQLRTADTPTRLDWAQASEERLAPHTCSSA